MILRSQRIFHLMVFILVKKTEVVQMQKKFGQKFIVGISCSDSYELYVNAKKEGADYVAFGPTFKTQNKKKKKFNLTKS